MNEEDPKTKALWYLLNQDLPLNSEETNRFCDYLWEHDRSSMGTSRSSSGEPIIYEPLRKWMERSLMVKGAKKAVREAKEKGLQPAKEHLKIIQDVQTDLRRFKKEGASINELISYWNDTEIEYLDPSTGKVRTKSSRRAKIIRDKERLQIAEFVFSKVLINRTSRLFRSVKERSKIQYYRDQVRRVFSRVPEVEDLVSKLDKFGGSRSIKAICAGNSKWTPSSVINVVSQSNGLLIIQNPRKGLPGRPSPTVYLGYPVSKEWFRKQMLSKPLDSSDKP
jgi:predicted ATPase